MIQDKQREENSFVLLEQYKLYVEMADRVSARRADTNKFYISLLTALLALLSIVIERNALPRFQNVIILVVAVLGLVLCYIWIINIRSYRQLNSGKFKVIHEMEQHLPFASYEREWELLAKGADKGKYTRLSRIEQYIPMLLAIPYLLLLVYAVYLFFF